MRDGSVLLDDYFVVGLDTYNDKRTAYYFWTGWKRNDKLSQVSCFGALAGIKNIRKGRHIEVKPYMLAGRESSENTSENTLKYGVDMMYGIMSNLTLDLTTHTDFA